MTPPSVPSTAVADGAALDVPPWSSRVEQAQPGDLLVWADEAAATRHAIGARLCAGQALLRQQVFELALEQFEAVLAADAAHAQARSNRVLCLAGLGRRAALRFAFDALSAPERLLLASGLQSLGTGTPAQPPGPAAVPTAAEWWPTLLARQQGPRPGRVLLFSGHMVDAPERARPRFPPALVPAAAAAINERLDALGANAGDLALTQGAAGGDLLFAEACLQRGVPLQLLLPLAQADFIAASLLPSCDGSTWRSRYLALTQRLQQAPREMPSALGPAPDGSDAFERCNRWLLNTALAQGRQRLHFLTLWDGDSMGSSKSSSIGRGGTQHMMEQVRQRGGEPIWIDTRELHP